MSGIASSGFRINSLKVARRRVSAADISSPSSVRRRKILRAIDLLFICELVCEDSFSRFCNGAAHAARGGIAAQRHRTSATSLPGFQ